MCETTIAQLERLKLKPPEISNYPGLKNYNIMHSAHFQTKMINNVRAQGFKLSCPGSHYSKVISTRSNVQKFIE